MANTPPGVAPPPWWDASLYGPLLVWEALVVAGVVVLAYVGKQRRWW